MSNKPSKTKSEDCVVYELKHPIHLVGADVGPDTTITQLKLYKPKGNALRKLPISFSSIGNQNLEIMVPFLKVWLKIDDATFDMMDYDDIIAIMEIMGDFLGISPETGEI